MNTPTKGQLWLLTGCAVIVLLTISQGFSLVRHRATEREMQAIKKDIDGIKEYLRDSVAPLVETKQKLLVEVLKEHDDAVKELRTKQEATAQRLEDVIRAANADIVGIRKEIRDEFDRNHAGQQAAIKAIMDIHIDDRKAQLEARKEDMQHNYEERMILRREIMESMAASHR